MHINNCSICLYDRTSDYIQYRRAVTKTGRQQLSRTHGYIQQ